VPIHHNHAEMSDVVWACNEDPAGRTRTASPPTGGRFALLPALTRLNGASTNLKTSFQAEDVAAMNRARAGRISAILTIGCMSTSRWAKALEDARTMRNRSRGKPRVTA